MMNDVRPITPVEHAEAFARKYVGLRIQDQADSVERTVTWPELATAFQAAAESAVDEYIRSRAEKVNWGDDHEVISESPTDSSETPHRIPAQSMIIRFMNGAEEIIHMHHPMIEQHGWTFRELRGIPYLVLGHGSIRRQYPLCNIAFIELSPELL